jgi:hypothetical protein
MPSDDPDAEIERDRAVIAAARAAGPGVVVGKIHGEGMGRQDIGALNAFIERATDRFPKLVAEIDRLKAELAKIRADGF